jgi:hypothetical protein
MADKKQEMEIWSWNEAFPGFDIQGETGIPKQELEKIFGDYDIKIRVPDKNDFLNPEQTGSDKFESERKVLTDFLNSLRNQLNIKEKPFNAYSEEEKKQIQLKQKYLNEVKQEQAMASDPMKEMNAKWRQKLDEDNRNWSTFLTGKGTDHGGPIRTGLDLWNADTMEEGYNTLKNYFGDSFMGLGLTAMRMVPENNKQNWAISGELMGNLPLYFMNKKKLANAWLNPRKYPIDMGKVTLSAGAGAYTMATAYDGLNDIIRQLKGLPDPELSTDPRVENLVHGRNGLIFTAGAASLDPVFQGMKGLARWTYGVSRGTDAEALAKLSIKQGIPFGIANVTDRSWAKWYGRVLGVFPFVGTPLRASKAEVAWYLDKRIMDTFNELAPMSSVMDIGALITKQAQSKFNQFAKINARFYDDFFTKATALDDMVGNQGYIPTTRVKELAKSWQEQMKRQKVTGRSYEQGVPGSVGGIEDATDFEKFLVFLGGIDDHLTANQFRGLQKKFNEAWRSYSKTYGPEAGDTIASDANKFKKALEQGLNDTKEWKLPTGPDGQPIQGTGELMEQVISSLNRANKYFGEMANTYSTPLAKRFSLVDEKMFIPGALEQPGWTYGDQLAQDLFSTFFKNPSKEALADLSKIVKRNLKNPSEDAINRAARGYFQELFNGSSDVVSYNMKNGQFKINVAAPTDTTMKVNVAGSVWASGKDIVNVNIFNPKKFADSLKLGTKDGDEFLTELWKQTLKADGKTLSQKEAKEGLQNLSDLMVLAQRGYDTKIAETAQFVARRATLAGVSGISGAFLATSAGVSPLTGVGMALLARHQSKVLSSPETLKWLVTTMDDTIDNKIRRSNYVRLARVIFDDEDQIPEGLDIKDPEEVMNYLLGRDFGITGVDQSNVPPSQRSQEGIKKTFEPIKAPLIPRTDAETGPIEGGGFDQWKEQQHSKNLSGEIKSKIASNFTRPKGVPGRTTLNQNQRAALAGGNLYGAIAQAKHGGAVYNDGIMNLAGRRRP